MARWRAAERRDAGGGPHVPRAAGRPRWDGSGSRPEVRIRPTVDPSRRRLRVRAGRGRIEITPASDADDGVVDGAADGRQLTVAYWVDAPVGGLRVLDTNGLGSDGPAVVAERFRAAGVPEVEADFHVRSPVGRTYVAGALLMAVTLALVVLGPRPSRGTRWFWFWLLFAPLFLAVPLFAVAERMRPRRWPEGTEHPKGAAGRWNGLTGLAVGVLLSLATTAALRALAGASPIWFIQG